MIGGTPVRGPRLLLVNDDGIGATGLNMLVAAAHAVTDDVWTVAPATERSGASHAITLTTPLRVQELGDRTYSVDGSPVDCVALALSEILDRAPDIVLSGVNRGPNMADDILYSGTCGAAREAAVRGIPSVALSLASTPGAVPDWRAVEHHLPQVLAGLCASPMQTMVNVNFPSIDADQVAGVRSTTIGRYPGTRLRAVAGTDPRDVPYRWLQLLYPEGPFPAGTDIAAVQDGYISVCPVRVEMTDDDRLAETDSLISRWSMTARAPD